MTPIPVQCDRRWPDERPMFAEGEKVVYPSHGVGVIEKRVARSIGGRQEPCYVIRILERGITVTVPLSSLTRVGLRPLMCGADLQAVLDVLRRERSDEPDNWNQRQKVYQEKIKSGSPFELAEVVRDLEIIRRGKDLSYGEKNILETARGLLISEIAHARAVEPDEAARLLDGCID